MGLIFWLLGNIRVTINPKDRHRFPHVHIYKGDPKRPEASALIALVLGKCSKRQDLVRMR
jgi:hypothetical protein